MATAWVLGEFKDDAALLSAARRLREAGHRGLDVYSPIPLHGADEALGLRKSPVPLIALIGGLVGASSGYLMQWWMNAVDFPINVGNRGLNAAPAFIPITFETGVLIASLSIVLGLFALCGFPRPYHPVFEVESFRTASVGAFWLSVEVPPADAERVRRQVDELGALQVSVVPRGEP